METATEPLGFDCVDITYDADCHPNATWNNDLLSEVIKEYGPRLRMYLSRNLRVYDDVDDLLQEVYIRIMSYPEPENIRSLKAFTFTIATNLLRDKSRLSCTRVSEHGVPVDTVELSTRCADPQKILEDRENLNELNRAINRLQPNCKRVFLQHRIEGKSYKEIAFGMGVTVSMVEKHIIEALKQLRKRVQFN